MTISGLTLIGESINDSVPSTHALFETKNMDAIVGLARAQVDKGASYIDVNVGLRPPGFMAEVVRKIQAHVSAPLSIDTPDPEIAAAGLEVYDAERAGGRNPILNSISESRLAMFGLYTIHPFIPILLMTEGTGDSGTLMMNVSAEQSIATARSLVDTARNTLGLLNDRIILDPGIFPLASDSKGHFKRLMAALGMIHGDRDLGGIGVSVGLSNFTALLPSKRPDGSPVKGPLESAFITMAMPVGLNTVIGSTARSFSLLPEDHPAMLCLKDILQMDGIQAILRVMRFYS